MHYIGVPITQMSFKSRRYLPCRSEGVVRLDQQTNGALESIFKLVKMIQVMKDKVIDQIEGEQGDIWDTNGEGRVRYADMDKQFGNVKLVPRKRWTPS